MSQSTAAKKRKVNVLEEDGSSAGQSTSGPRGEGEKPSQASSRNFPSREPFDFVADLAIVEPQDIFGSIRGLSEARYLRDLSGVFNEAAATSNEGLIAMHKTWFECRKPTADEPWTSKYHGTQSYKPTGTKDIMRSVLTLQTMRNQLNDIDNPPLAEKLMVMHFDYIMLMCLNGASPGKRNIQDEMEHRFPAYEEQFGSIAEELRRMRFSTAGPSSKGMSAGAMRCFKIYKRPKYVFLI